jgi:acetyl-CoA carboxylase carboxyltransferase component
MSPEDPRIIELRQMRARVHQAGGEKRVAAQHAKGKLTARERIDLLLDEATFHELEPYSSARSAGNGSSDDANFGDGVVTGYGLVDGRMVFVYAQDFTISGGSLGEVHGRKICRLMDLAVQSGAPIVGLIDSGGARIQEGVRSLGGYAEVFQRNSRYSGVVPQISVIMGPCAGGAAYSPAVTDLIIMVDKASYMFLTGPEVIRSVTGEEIDAENLGGAAVHLGVSGLAHLSASDEKQALQLSRAALSYLPQNNVENPPVQAPNINQPLADAGLNSIVPLDPQTPYSMLEVIQRIVDEGTFLELQATFACNARIGFARMNGASVGIVAQEPSVMAGVLDIDSSDKIARFVRLCDCYNIPLITLVDSPGFLPGVDQEHRGVIRHGAKVLFAFSEATVPKISIVTRKAYGGAYVVMSSKYMGGDINFAWPSAEIAVMGAEGAANILYRKQIDTADDPKAERDRLTEEYRQKFLNPYAAAQAGYIDEIIEPCETRERVIAALAALRDKHVAVLPRKHGNMPV